MSDCIFCKIAAGEIPSKRVYEDDVMLAFHDIDPKAPVHVVLIPKAHIVSVNALTVIDQALAGHIMVQAAHIARELGVAEDGYRIVTNIGKDGGQSVPHLHFHLLGGRKLAWPPG